MVKISPLILFIAAALSLSSCVFAWGPVSHYYMLCAALNPDAAAECLTNPKFETMLIASDMPDGLAGFAAPTFQYNSACPPTAEAGAYHDPLFASYLVKWATTPEIQALAIGYGSHMIADAVGFHNKGGYLSNGIDTLKGDLNWITMWPKMAAIDSFIIDSNSIPISNLPSASPPAHFIEFLSNSSIAYQKIHSTFPTYNSTVLGDCTASWSAMINRLYPYYTNAIPSPLFESQLVYFDQKGATTFAETRGYLESGLRYGAFAVAKWIQLIVQPDVTPIEAVTQTMSFIDSLFN